VWHDNGQLWVDEMCERDALHGRCREWHANGDLLCDDMWENGRLVR
jgi:antitoxin component YwqK of YwqJK toxin-antitoxin module